VNDKDFFRNLVWTALQTEGAARSNRVRDRIPDFHGAQDAARLVFELPTWQQARAIKSNPDRPQRPLRQRALEEGKVLYMAVPRLRSEQCFVELDPATLNASPAQASTITGAFRYGRLVYFEEMRPVDLVVSGSVAVNRQGTRIGKGGGFADLEYGLAAATGVVQPDTPVITTVHSLQVLDQELPWTQHDVPLDFVATPDEVIQCPEGLPKPNGIYWDDLDQWKIAKIPLLKKLQLEKLKLEESTSPR
jgi:5-formyltetrahydrofolate cyclo-ligase